MTQEISDQKFEKVLVDLVDENPASNLLWVPGVYEAVSEEFHNAVIERIEQESEEKEPEPEPWWTNEQIKECLYQKGCLSDARDGEPFPSRTDYWIFNTDEIPPDAIRRFLFECFGVYPFEGGPGRPFGEFVQVGPWLGEGFVYASQRIAWDV